MAGRQTQARLILSGLVLVICAALAGVVFLLARSSGGEGVAQDVAVTTTSSTVLNAGQQLQIIQDGLSQVPKTEPYFPVGEFSFTSPDGIYWYPSSEADGPAAFDETESRGFSQTETGAALAAIHLYYRFSPLSVDWQANLSSQGIGPGVEVRERINERAASVLDSSALSQLTYPAGWDVLKYTDTDATLLIYYGSQAFEDYDYRELRVVWVDDDWKLVIDEEGSWDSALSTIGPSDVDLGGAFR